MSFITEMIPDPKILGDRQAANALSAFREALRNGETGALPTEQRDLAARIDQANAKIASRVEIVRTGELMTLSQFGAGSLGAAISSMLKDPGAVAALENLMTARFLTEIVLSSGSLPHLFPGDLLKRENVMREAILWPVAAPVFQDVTDRAVLALRQAATRRNDIATKPARKFFDREYARVARQIRKMAGKDPDSRAIRLNGLDRVIISLTILLHIRTTP